MALRRFFEPTTIFAAVAGLQVVQGVVQGNAERRAANDRAAFLEVQAVNEAEAGRREQRALAQRRAELTGRSRAALAAAGADLSSGSSLAILTSQEKEFATESKRLEADSALRIAGLQTRARNERTAGRSARDQAIFGGVSAGLGTLAATQGRTTLLRRNTTARPTGPFSFNFGEG